MMTARTGCAGCRQVHVIALTVCSAEGRTVTIEQIMHVDHRNAVHSTVDTQAYRAIIVRRRIIAVL